jgi:hypothetical protein
MRSADTEKQIAQCREKQIPRFARDDRRFARDDRGVGVKQLLALALAVSIVAGCAIAQPLEEKSTDRKTFSGARELIIDNITGFIEVTAGSGNTVEVEIEKSLKARSQDRMELAKKEISLAVEQDGGLVQLLAIRPTFTAAWFTISPTTSRFACRAISIWS